MPSHRVRSLFLISLGHLTIELCSSFLPIIYPSLMASMQLNYTQIGAIALAAGLGTSLLQPLFGYLSDLWKPRWISALSIAWIGLLMGLVGVTKSYGLIVAVVGLGALGSAAFHPSGASITSSSAGKRRGTAASMFSVAGTVGGALSPLYVEAGVRWMGMRGTSLLVPVALVVGVLLLIGLTPSRDRDGHQADPRRIQIRRDVAVRLALIVMAVMCLASFAGAFKTYLPIWVESQSDAPGASGKVLFAYLASMGIGSLIGGTLSDRLGRWQLYALCIGLLGPVEWAFLASSGPLQLVLVGATGLLVGATFPVAIVLAQETWPQGIGIASGLVIGLGWAPSGIGASLTGLVADRFSLETGLRWLALPSMVGVACMLAYATARRPAPEVVHEAPGASHPGGAPK
jgi:FSR family fosmidomycin resistance protein-like MFS transporter